jgi:hypothetical protein
MVAVLWKTCVLLGRRLDLPSVNYNGQHSYPLF